jgi:hypothetical protein
MKAVSKEVTRVVNEMFVGADVKAKPEGHYDEVVITPSENPSDNIMRDDNGDLRGWFMSKMITQEDGSKKLECGITGNSFFVGRVLRNNQLFHVLFLVYKNMSKDNYGKLSVWEYAHPIQGIRHARQVIMSLCGRQRADERGKGAGRYFFATKEYNGLPIWKMNRSFIPSTETFQQEIVDVFAEEALQLCKGFNLLQQELPTEDIVDRLCSVFQHTVSVTYTDENGEVTYREVRDV